MVLVTSCLSGARVDHGDVVWFGAGVYAEVINSLCVDEVVCFCPHSPVFPEVIAPTVIDFTLASLLRVAPRATAPRTDTSRPQEFPLRESTTRILREAPP